MTHIATRLSAIVFAFTISVVALGQTQVPNTFSAGQPARATEVNDNFSALVTAVDDNANNIASLDGRVSSVEADIEIRSYKVAQGDPNFPLFPFPPWDLGPLPGGFSADILNAICNVNDSMECEIVIKPYEECLFSDLAQPSSIGIGTVLLDEDIVGCLSWGRTNVRVSRGIATTFAYSNSSAPGTHDSVILSANGSVNAGNTLAVENGLAADLACANAAGHTYSAQEIAPIGVQAVVDAVDANTDAIVLSEYLPFVSFPPGVVIATTFESDGTTPLKCFSGFRVITYPPANIEVTRNFIYDFNCGLYLIAQNGTYDAICATYALDSSEPPYCLNSSEIVQPRNSCR